jgi:hypothetical protein
MITQMFIEGNPIDVSEYFSTLITYALDDVKDFSSRNTSFSKTIVLPGTANNNKVFGHIFDMGSANPYDAALPNVLMNFNAAKSAKCYLFQDNIQVFKGIVRLLEIIVDQGRKEYEVAVFGELGGLISAMGNKKLEDLDFSAYNLNYNIANISGSWDNAPGSGVYFPLMDYGNYSTGKHDWDFKTFRPALYVKEYLDKIFAQTSYTYNCALFNTTRFKSFVIPHNQKILTKNTALIADAINGPGQTILDSSVPRTADSQTWYSFIGGLFTQSLDKKTFTYTGAAGTMHLKWTVSGTYQADSTSVMRIYVRKNGSLFFWDSRGLATAPTAIAWSRSYDDITFALAPGDTFDFHADLTSTGTTYMLDIINATFQIRSDNAVASPIALNDPIVINDTIPRNYLQTDFFCSILKLFNLYVWEDPFTERLLNITPYKDFYDTNSANAVDWTYKLNREKPIRIKPLSELNSRYYEFRFKPDSDFYNEEYRKRYNQSYGDLIYDSLFEFAGESNSAELIFSGTVLVGYSGQDKIYSTVFKQSNGLEEQIDCNIRILQTKKITSVSSWDIKNGATVLGSYTAYGYAGHLDDPNAPANDLNFGAPKSLYFVLAAGALNVNQFNVYWSAYMAEITDKDSRLLTASFRLNAKDIYNLDFSKFVHIDGNLYRLNKIEDYNASNPDECMVTLLKVIQTLY